MTTNGNKLPQEPAARDNNTSWTLKPGHQTSLSITNKITANNFKDVTIILIVVNKPSVFHTCGCTCHNISNISKCIQIYYAGKQSVPEDPCFFFIPMRINLEQEPLPGVKTKKRGKLVVFAPEHPIIATWNNGIQNRCRIGKKNYSNFLTRITVLIISREGTWITKQSRKRLWVDDCKIWQYFEPRSQDLSSRGREDERPWKRGWQNINWFNLLWPRMTRWE